MFCGCVHGTRAGAASMSNPFSCYFIATITSSALWGSCQASSAIISRSSSTAKELAWELGHTQQLWSDTCSCHPPNCHLSLGQVWREAVKHVPLGLLEADVGVSRMGRPEGFPESVYVCCECGVN